MQSGISEELHWIRPRKAHLIQHPASVRGQLDVSWKSGMWGTKAALFPPYFSPQKLVSNPRLRITGRRGKMTTAYKLQGIQLALGRNAPVHPSCFSACLFPPCFLPCKVTGAGPWLRPSWVVTYSTGTSILMALQTEAPVI